MHGGAHGGGGHYGAHGGAHSAVHVHGSSGSHAASAQDVQEARNSPDYKPTLVQRLTTVITRARRAR